MTEKESNIEECLGLLPSEVVDISIDRLKYRNNHYSIYYEKLINNEDVTVTVFNGADATDGKIKCLIDILTSIQHSNLEKYIGTLKKQSSYYVITKREGKKLSKILKKKDKSKITLRKCNRTIIAFNIALTMAYLHSINIIHGDLCTSNITIDKNCKLKIMNFTNSHFFKEDSNITRNFDTISTFNSPEFSKCSNYNKSVDVFSFAGILYELLMGRPPFDGLSKSEIKNKIENGERPELKCSKENKFDYLKDLIEKCWAKEPKDRPTFYEIIELMITKKIAFPVEDSEDNEIIEQFYSQKSIEFNNCMYSCIQQFKNSDECFIFENISLRIKHLLQEYHFQMFNISFQMESRNSICEDKFANLNEILTDFKELLSQITKKKWMCYGLSCPAKDILDNIYYMMEQIYIEMNELGFIVNKYEHDETDLSKDLSELYEIYSSHTSYTESSQRIEEIESFSRSHSILLKKNPIESNESITNLFSQFKSYEINQDDLELGKCIGDGMSSKVYQAEVKEGRKIKNSDKKNFAVKIIKEEFLKDKLKFILLKREVTYLVMLHHEYIANFVGFNYANNDHVWIISELASNGNLYDAIEHVKLNPFQKTKIAFEIAEGMEYLHSMNIIHRDLKSLNVLLDGDTPKITDFGLARDCSNEMSWKTGTIQYMAPEVNKSKYYDFKADVYSYACLLWELYSGSYPFSDYDFSKHNNDDYFDILSGPLDFKKPISDDLKDLIIKGRSINPLCRPSFTEIIDMMIKQKIAFPNKKKSKNKKKYDDEIDEFYKRKAEKRKKEDDRK